MLSNEVQQQVSYREVSTDAGQSLLFSLALDFCPWLMGNRVRALLRSAHAGT